MKQSKKLVKPENKPGSIYKKNIIKTWYPPHQAFDRGVIVLEERTPPLSEANAEEAI